MDHGPASTSGRFALRLNLAHIDKRHFEQVGAMAVIKCQLYNFWEKVSGNFIDCLWSFPSMREICMACKAKADAHIASFVGLQHILKNLLEHGHVGVDIYCSPFYFQLSRDGSSPHGPSSTVDDIRSGSSVIDDHEGLDAAALVVAGRHFNYESGDHYVMPFVRFTGYFLSSLELIDPWGGESRHPLFGNGCFTNATFRYLVHVDQQGGGPLS